MTVCSMPDCDRSGIYRAKPPWTGRWCDRCKKRWVRAGDPAVVDDARGRAIAWLAEALKNPDQSTCWIWPFSHNNHGYGWIDCKGRKRLVTHLVMEALGQPRPSPEHGTLHSCDTPLCFNPAHIRWGTAAENTADRVSRNRQAKGETAGNSKLTEADVRAIRANESGLGATALARRYGVSSHTIRYILNGTYWRHVEVSR